MHKTLKISIISTGLLFAANVTAVPNTFTAGQPARAADVNANFTDVEQQITNNAGDIQTNANDIQINSGDITANANAVAAIATVPVFDYRNFLAEAGITSKTFVTTGLCGATEVRTISRVANGANIDVTISRRRLDQDGVTTCQLREFSYVNTPTQRLLVANRGFSLPAESPGSTRTPVDPIVVGASSMSANSTIANGTQINDTPAGGAPVFIGTLVDARVAVGLEDVSVPAGNFTGCLKYSIIRQSTGFGQFQRVTWTCPGVGEVKRIQTNNQVWELTTISTSP